MVQRKLDVLRDVPDVHLQAAQQVLGHSIAVPWISDYSAKVVMHACLDIPGRNKMRLAVSSGCVMAAQQALSQEEAGASTWR